VVVRNAPFFETIDVSNGDFVWPLLAPSIDQAEAVWHRRWVTKRYLLDRKDVYKNLKDVEGVSAGRYRDSRREQFDWQGTQVSERPDELDPEEGIVELWTRWTDDGLVTIANPYAGTPVIVRDEENPFQHNRKPFLDWAPIPHPFQMHGVGIIQTIFDQNEDLNTLRRQVRDCLTYIVNPVWKSIGVPGEQLSLFPGRNIQLDGELEDIAPLINPVVDFGAAYQMEQEMKRDMRDTTGAHEALSGAPSLGQQTATEFAGLQAEGNVRVAEMIKVFEQRTMHRFGHLLASMNVQYLDSVTAADFSDDPEAEEAWKQLQEAQGARSSGEDSARGGEFDPGFVEVTPEMLRPLGRLEPLPSVGQDKMLSDIQKRSDAAQALQALAPLLAIPSVAMLVNFPQLASWVLEQYGVPKMQRQQILKVPPEQLQALLGSQLL
ncbi:MAG: portal protein, partial [Candidatus Rokuibacteriota bacterium]